MGILTEAAISSGLESSGRVNDDMDWEYVSRD
ncbi:hypothetical protein POPTR_013G098033v4 [Populus trichocarpa]|uniref:Uncharacterized protein n=1 Tax=Populus trichocarpa TaxID=3694 RepID=A0ACC0S2Z4_POPTR|nr:hypothetical protein POPTR_013G098033v4 [Populus trichocarpa]